MVDQGLLAHPGVRFSRVDPRCDNVGRCAEQDADGLINGDRFAKSAQLGRSLSRGGNEESAATGPALDVEDRSSCASHGSLSSDGDPQASCSESSAPNVIASTSSRFARACSTDDFPEPGAPVSRTAVVVTQT